MPTAQTIPLARPAIGDAELNAAERVLRSGRLVLGPENERFERGLADRTGRAHAVAVASGTVALELALWAAGIGPGDDVLISAFGFPAAVNAVLRLGARPVAVDVEPDTWNTSAAALDAAHTARTKLSIAIDQLGLPGDGAALAAVCAARGTTLLGDAACGFGGRDRQGEPGGRHGLAAILSFHPRKLITSGEGGAIVTDDAALAESLRRLRNQGQAGRGQFDRVGTNARLGEINAAIGSAQLARLDDMLAERRLLAAGYHQRLASLHGRGRISWQQVPAGAMHTHQTFSVLLADGVDRARACARLAGAGIEAGPATYAFVRVASFDGLVAAPPCPVAEALHERALALPLYIGMRSAELDRVCEELTLALEEQA